MFAQKENVSITTDGAGAGTGYTNPVTGRILAIVYTKDGTAPYTNGVDWVVSLEGTGEVIWTGTDVNASTVKYPRVPVQDETGADALFAAGGTKLREPVMAANDRVKIVISSGGATHVGAFTVVVG
jgi:hypothetical protein